MAKKDQQAPQASDDSGVTFVKKISAKTIMGRVRAPEKATALYRAIGQVSGIKTGQSDNGTWNAFLGAFEAIRVDTGEVFQGSQCFLPSAISDLLVASVRKHQENDAGALVEFAVEVGVKPSDTPIGYEYTVKNLIKPSGGDPLAALRGKVEQLALAAPTV